MRIVKAGGEQKFRLIPTIFKWGTNISLFWLSHEWVLMYGKRSKENERRYLKQSNT